MPALSKFAWAVKPADMPEGRPCKYATLVPKVQKTGVKGSHEDAMLVRLDVVAGVDLLMRHPQHAGAFVSWMKLRLEREAANATLATGDTLLKVDSLGKLDEVWLAKWLVSRSKLTKQGLERARLGDPKAIVNLTCLELNTLPSLHLPDECTNVEVLSMTLSYRAETQGGRLKGVKDDSVSATGLVDYVRIGVYEVVWREGLAVAFKHRPTGDIADCPPHVVINEDFCLVDNWSDVKAHCIHSLDGTRYAPTDYFPAGTGPHRSKTLFGKSVAFNNMARHQADDLEKQRAARRPAAGANSSSDTAWFSQSPEQVQQKIKHARDALKRRNEELTKRRRLSLKTSAAA